MNHHRADDKTETVRNSWLVTIHRLPNYAEDVRISEGGITLYWHGELTLWAQKQILHWFSFYVSVWILKMMLTFKYLLSSTCCCIFSKTRLLLYPTFFSWKKKICSYHFFNIPNSCSNHFKISLLHYIHGICTPETCFQPWMLSRLKPWFILGCPPTS